MSSVGYRHFVDCCDGEHRPKPYIVGLMGDGVKFGVGVHPGNVAVPSYDFADMRDQLKASAVDLLRQQAFAINDRGGFQLPADDFALLFNLGDMRVVALVNKQFGTAIDNLGNHSGFRAKVYIHRPSTNGFEWVGVCGLGGFKSMHELDYLAKIGRSDVKCKDTTDLIRLLGFWLDAFLMLLHLRSESRIIRFHNLPESGAHKAINYKRRQAGEALVETSRLVYVSTEPLVGWLSSQERGASRGSHASPVPHDRREYWRRPKGGTEKTIKVRASKVCFGVQV